MSTIDITGVVPVSSRVTGIERIPQGYEANYEAPAHPALVVERSWMESGATLFTTSDPVTGIFGAGSSPMEAIEDLLRAQIEHREVLEAQESLSPALEAQLKHLQRR